MPFRAAWTGRPRSDPDRVKEIHSAHQYSVIPIFERMLGVSAVVEEERELQNHTAKVSQMVLVWGSVAENQDRESEHSS